MSFSASGGASRRLVLGGLATLPTMSGLLQPARAQAQAQTASTRGGFSFAAVGDTRPMMYLPRTRASRTSSNSSSRCSASSCRNRSRKKS